jgi:exonuclease III
MGSSQRTSAGTAILVDRMMAPLVTEDKILLEGRVQSVTIHLPDDSTLTIINTYASRTSRSRAPLWKRISEANLTSDHTIIGGDFNHFEEMGARGVAGHRCMHRRESAAWHQMTLQYGLTDDWTLDSFRKMSKKEFTYDNGRKGQGAVVSRIDKFLVSQELDSKGGRIEAAPSIRRISDHSPLVLTIWGRPSTPPTPATYFDTALLKEEAPRAALLDAWTGTQPTPGQDVEWPAWLEEASGRVLKCNLRIAREKKKAKGASIRNLHQKIKLAEVQLQRDLEDEPTKEILSRAQGHLADTLQEKITRNHQLNSASWFRYGDTCSKLFFDFHRIGKKRTPLKELKTEEGDIKGQEDLAHYVRSFYTRLYTSEANAPGTSEAREDCWVSTPTRISDVANDELTKELTLKEIKEAITAMPKDKASGGDGIPTEFFQEFIEEISLTLLQAFSAMLRGGETSEWINKGLITLIPKSGDHAKIGNWRPITLLGSLYKILAKTLARRLQDLLPNVVRPNQTGFVEGRSILDNTFLAQEAQEWAKESNQDLVLLLFDFEKAFDRIEWGFLFEALAKLDFCPRWIRWVSLLYTSASSTIKLNGVEGAAFPLARSVRQGCPLSPYLFILATDVLGHMLDDPRFGVEGLTLPGGRKIRDQTFADDTALYLQGTRENMEKTQKVLDIFCKASGAKINWKKTAAIWASKKERDWEWGQDVGLQWIPEGQSVRYLGIQVGFHLPSEVNFGKMVTALKGKLIN